MNTNNTLEEKFQTFLDSLPLSVTERKSAEDFLLGNVGREVLCSFTFENLSTVIPDPAIRLFRELVKNGKRDIASRLFSVLLAKGDSTCFRMILMDIIDPEKGAVDVEVDAAKKAATYAAIIGADLYPLGSYSRDRLVDIACGKTEILRQAIQYEKNDSDHGKLVLYAVYFYKKYKCENAQEKQVMEEDLPLLACYEEIAIEYLDRVYPPFHLSVTEIKEAVKNGEVTDRILKLAGLKHGISCQKLKLVASLAYLNYPLSGKLKDVVKICLAANPEEALEAMNLIGLTTPLDLYVGGGAYDREFNIPAKTYIRWSAKKGHTLVLERQLEDNPEAYFELMDEADFDTANQLFIIIKKKKPEVYKELMAKRKVYHQDKVINKLLSNLVRKDPDAEMIRSYLIGEVTVDKLYPFVDQLGKNYYYNGGGGREFAVLRGTDKNIVEGALYRRFQTYMWMYRGFSFIYNNLREDWFDYSSKVSANKVEALFENFEYEGLDIARQLSGIGQMEECYLYGSNRDVFHAGILKVFGRYLEERRSETIAAFKKGDAAERLFGIKVLSQKMEENKAEILYYVGDSSKKVKQFMLELLIRQTGWAEEIKEMLSSKKSAVREFAIRVLAAWKESGMDCQELLVKALEVEKSAKLKELLSDMLNVEDGGVSAGKSLTQKELVQEIHKGGRKRSLSWAYETPFSVVHTVAGEKAGEEYLQAILLYYYSMTTCGYNEKAAFLAKALVADEFAVYVNELFDKWLELGAEAKKRWVLYAAAIHGGNEIIERFKRQLKEWPRQARGMIACEAVQALSLNPMPQALLTVDGIARKFKYRQVKTAAGDALSFAAEQLGITREELADRIVPDLGFDEGLGRTFDYGGRKFRVLVTPALEFEVYEELEDKAAENKDNENPDLEQKEETGKKHILGKKLKNLPAPGKRDDEKKAAAAYEEFKQMKKQMKEVIASQTMRLEQALSSARLWSVESWKQLFVKNPIMHQFATGLIWGIYEGGRLVQSFRYMEDGSFNTQDEEEYVLPDNNSTKAAADQQENIPAASGEGKQAQPEGAKIGLVHPIELSVEEREVWRQQLADYEISQPFLQLERLIYTPGKEELNESESSRFCKRVVNDMSLNSRLTAAGWYHGMVIDGGCIKSYCSEDKGIGMGAILNFSGGFVGCFNENVTIESLCFYRLGQDESNCPLYERDDIEKCLIKDVPAKYFSEITLQVDRATAQPREEKK